MSITAGEFINMRGYKSYCKAALVYVIHYVCYAYTLLTMAVLRVLL
jgi:hypothetical protein